MVENFKGQIYVMQFTFRIMNQEVNIKHPKTFFFIYFSVLFLSDSSVQLNKCYLF